MCYQGTTIINGMGIIKVTKVGKKTEFGLIGESLKDIRKEKTPLERQINKLVLVCTIISSIVFLLTIIINYLTTKNIVDSILSGITVAMATIPEEIPVILTVFLAMGAWSLAKENTLTKNMKAVETLGAINVLCTDKTGTLTENKMVVESVYEYSDTFIKTAYYACPKIAYDSMDIAIKKYCLNKKKFKDLFSTKEYAFTPKDKMMGQIWNNKLLCVKGAYENILPLCNLKNEEEILKKIDNFSKKGYRVIAVAKNDNINNIYENIHDYNLSFEGLIAIYDPPRTGVSNSLNKCYNAGIRVIMITGDNGETAKGIAKNINLKNNEEIINGSQLEKMTDEELMEAVKTSNIFARIYPNHKMRIVTALQKNNNIVAMTGDGINDAPALKKANIGIAMGKRGTNVAKEAADLILLDDNFNTIVTSIENGRTIYNNIKKAISYILVIHIPIALISLLVPLFKLPTLLLPIHVLLLELLIDPTSSIIFQKIKPDTNIMEIKPRNINESILNLKTIIINILQGIFIFLIVFITYYILIKRNIDTNLAITISYSTLVLSTMLITYQLRSSSLTITNFIDSFKDKICILVNLGITISLLMFIYIPFFNNVANTTPLDIKSWLFIIFNTLLAIIVFDILKINDIIYLKRRKHDK